jgi:hypothetical protein
MTALTPRPEHANEHEDRPDRGTDASHTPILRGRVRSVKTVRRSSKISGDLATNRDQQELGMLSLHILQGALACVSTLMIQDILAEPEWPASSPPKTSEP